MSIIYIDRKGYKRQGETGQDRLLAFIYGHAVTRCLIRPFPVSSDSKNHRFLFLTGKSKFSKDLFCDPCSCLVMRNSLFVLPGTPDVMKKGCAIEQFL